MAGEIAHVVYAARLLTHLGPKIHDPQYWVGTLFADIRELGVTTRQATHPRHIGLHSLVGSSDWHTGLRVHAWLDATSDQYLRESRLSEQLPWHPLLTWCLSLLEDELLYPYFEDWNLIQRLLNEVHATELQYATDQAAIQSWHSLLQKYFAQAPTDQSRLHFGQDLGLSPALMHETNEMLGHLRRDGRAQQQLEGFWAHLEDVLR